MSLTTSENKELANLEYHINSTKIWLNSLKKEEDYNLPEIKSRIEDLFRCANGYSKDFFYRYFTTDGLYRARKHKESEDLFRSTNDFWYRDWSNVSKDEWRYDRLNMPGESVWYFSNSMKACIAEIRPQKNDIISLANIKQIKSSKRFNYFLELGSAFLRKEDSGLDTIHREADKNRNSKLSAFEKKKLKLIDDFFDEIYLCKVSEKETYKYMPSIAITHILRQSRSGITTDGIVYPSVAFEQNAVNVALLNPKRDEFNFYLYQTVQFKVEDAKEDNYYIVKPIMVGKNLHENQYGNFPIYWKEPRQQELEEYNFRIEINSTLCPL